MRGSNASRSLSLSICTLSIFSTLILADDYRIGYRAVVKDALLVDEKLNISHSMTPCIGKAESYTVFNTTSRDLSKIIKDNRDKFYNFLVHQNLHVKYNSKTVNSISTTLTTLTFPTECFKVDFKGNLAKITLVK